MKTWIILLIISTFAFSCSSDDDSAVREENQIAIEAYLADNNLEAESTSSGLYYIVENEGNGNFPNSTSFVTVLYSGYDLEGNVFDSASMPVTFSLPNLIPGWQEGIPKFSVGGSGKLLIPAHLAYGANPPSSNEPIIFDMTLLTFE